MGKKQLLRYVETEGGTFILLPLELKKVWQGRGDPDDDGPNDCDRTEEFLCSVGALDIDSPKGKGQALVLGTAEVTAFRPLDDGGVFIQRIYGDDDADVIATVDKALAETKGWKKHKVTFNPGSGKLALFDAAYAYNEAERDERLPVELPPGRYRVEEKEAKTKDVCVNLVRLRAQPEKRPKWKAADLLSRPNN